MSKFNIIAIPLLLATLTYAQSSGESDTNDNISRFQLFQSISNSPEELKSHEECINTELNQTYLFLNYHPDAWAQDQCLKFFDIKAPSQIFFEPDNDRTYLRDVVYLEVKEPEISKVNPSEVVVNYNVSENPQKLADARYTLLQCRSSPQKTIENICRIIKTVLDSNLKYDRAVFNMLMQEYPTDMDKYMNDSNAFMAFREVLENAQQKNFLFVITTVQDKIYSFLLEFMSKFGIIGVARKIPSAEIFEYHGDPIYSSISMRCEFPDSTLYTSTIVNRNYNGSIDISVLPQPIVQPQRLSCTCPTRRSRCCKEINKFYSETIFRID